MRNEGIVELYAPRRTLIGRDGITKIPHFLQRLSSKCVLVVTDKGLIKVGTAGKVTAVLDNANIQYVVYDGVEPNPTTRIVYDALHFYQEHQCDAIIAIGGGSPIDVAKAVSILSANGGKIQDYNGYNKSKKRGTPIIAVNTTAGTGSECTRAYVVTDEETKTKMLMVDTNCLAHLALNDPMLMVGMPPSLTAATGIDALTHAIEAYICNTHTPYTDALSLEAVRLVSGSLRDAVRDGSNMDARTNMCWAEYMAGLAFSNAGLGLVHGIAHQLGGFYNIPHGLANAILLPRVLEYNRPYCMGRLATVAQAMGESQAGPCKAGGPLWGLPVRSGLFLRRLSLVHGGKGRDPGYGRYGHVPGRAHGAGDPSPGGPCAGRKGWIRSGRSFCDPDEGRSCFFPPPGTPPGICRCTKKGEGKRRPYLGL